MKRLAMVSAMLGLVLTGLPAGNAKADPSGPSWLQEAENLWTQAGDGSPSLVKQLETLWTGVETPDETATEVNGSSSYQSVAITGTGDGQYQARVEYLNQAGQMVQRTFQGTRDELARRIEADEELPGVVRDNLLSGLTPVEPMAMSAFQEEMRLMRALEPFRITLSDPADCSCRH